MHESRGVGVRHGESNLHENAWSNSPSPQCSASSVARDIHPHQDYNISSVVNYPAHVTVLEMPGVLVTDTPSVNLMLIA